MNSPPKGRNLVGIVPLSGPKKSFGMPWPDYLQPLSPDYTLVERSVYECALAGCDSIWIVCNDDVAPLVRKRIGDYVLDPVIYERWNFLKNKNDHKKYIPVFYTPIDQADRFRRDSLSWSIIHGAVTAFKVSSRISSWCRPSKYFVSFPWGVYDPTVVKPNRGVIRGKESFYLSYDNKTVRDNEYLSFTFFPTDWVLFKRNIKQKCSGSDKTLPFHERWSSRDFTLDKVFNSSKISIDNAVDLCHYWNVETWAGLIEYYKHDTQLSRPPKSIIKPFKFRRE